MSRRAAGKSGRFAGGAAVGAGPYAVESFAPEEVRLRRSPTWSPRDVPIERVRVRVVRDANARALMMVGGSADLTQNGVRVDLVDDLAARDRIAITTGRGARLTYLMLNTRDRALSDVRVRQAIALALDRERVLRTKLDGRAVLATGLLPPGHWAYSAAVPTYHRDLARAAALLDAAGYRDPDGPGGRPRLRLTYKTSSDALRVALARVWAAQLGEVGIAVEVQSFEFPTVFTDYKQGNYQIGSLQTATIAEPDFLLAYFHSSRIPSPDDPNALNRMRYASARVDELTELGRRTLDRGRRRALTPRCRRSSPATCPSSRSGTRTTWRSPTSTWSASSSARPATSRASPRRASGAAAGTRRPARGSELQAAAGSVLAPGARPRPAAHQERHADQIQDDVVSAGADGFRGSTGPRP